MTSGKSSDNMRSARSRKDDEFYTPEEIILRELKHYKEDFRGKVVFCNCDDPESSEFWKYFNKQFEALGLRKLVCTHYVPTGGVSYKLEVDRNSKFDQSTGLYGYTKTPLGCDGDFRSTACVKLLEECDIVCTNPPFSLFREYVKLTLDKGKKLLVIGNYNGVTYKEIFAYIMEQRLWLGASPRSMDFLRPDGKYQTVNSCWYTNMLHEKRNEELFLHVPYSSENYPFYDNYKAIEVSKVKDIPADYEGVMGVPITFLARYNPEQFDLLGTQRYFYDKSLGNTDGKALLGGVERYDRIFIRNRKVAFSRHNIL